jgi:hypothetical protein
MLNFAVDWPTTLHINNKTKQRLDTNFIMSGKNKDTLVNNKGGEESL